MRLIDADALNEQLHNIPDSRLRNQILGRIKRMPPIDAEPIIRCKDCKYWAEFTFNIPPFHFCGRLFQDGNTESIGFYMEADDFCSRGEKR